MLPLLPSAGIVSIISGNPSQVPADIIVHSIIAIVIVKLLWPRRRFSICPDDRLSPISLLFSLSPATKTFVANKHDNEYDNEEHEYDNKETEYSCWLGHNISCSRYVSSIYIHS